MKKILLPLLLLLCASPALADGLPATPYIYVQGAAEERIDPDTLRLSFSVTATDKDQARAKAIVSEKGSAVFKLLKQLGIKDEAVAAHGITVNENYEYSSNKRVLTGYNVTRDFTVQLTDLPLYPRLVDGLIELRIESIEKAQPSYSKARELAMKLKKDALTQARQQAEDLAAGMGARITGVFAASPIAYGEIPGAIFGGGNGPIALSAFVVQSERAGGTDKYVFEKLTLAERLHVIFLVEPDGK